MDVASLFRLELGLDSALKLLVVVCDKVEIGEGVSFLFRPFKMYAPFAEVVILRF